MVALSEPELEAFVAALTAAPLSAHVERSAEAAEAIVERLPSVPAEAVTQMVATLFVLYAVRAQADVGVSEFTSDLIEAMQQSGNSGLAVPEGSLAAVRTRLSRLLEIEPLATMSKAVGLSTDYPRTFCDARILTDLRPVFSTDPAARPVGAVVAHTLKIEYHDSSGHEEFFVALDSADISTLQNALERAVSKAKSLASLLKESNLPEINLL